MGFLGYFDLNKFLKHCPYFIETGLGGGAGIIHAKQFPFKKLYSMETIDVIYESGKAALEPLDDRIEIFQGTSIEILPDLLLKIPQEEGIVFWLDAHYPGADYGIGTHKDAYPADVKFPLVEELDIISKTRSLNNCIIICDDYRIYKEGKYDNGVLPEHADSRYGEVVMPKHYDVEVHCAHEGYLVLKGHGVGPKVDE